MIDWTKPIVTRDGLPARVICTDRVLGKWTHIVLVMEDDMESMVSCREDGTSVGFEKRYIRNVEDGQ